MQNLSTLSSMFTLSNIVIAPRLYWPGINDKLIVAQNQSIVEFAITNIETGIIIPAGSRANRQRLACPSRGYNLRILMLKMLAFAKGAD